MYSIFTTGYSNKIVWYNVNEDTLKITFQGDSEIDNKLSFGAVDKEHNCIYFVHEEKNEVSRWTIDKTSGEIPNLAKQEVPDNLSISTVLDLILY
jgi:6-phosphogluconolactonase (cycloisomerase 2 family)